MGQVSSQQTVQWAATLHRKKTTKKEYTHDELKEFVDYLKSESKSLKHHLKSLQQNPQGWQEEYGRLAPVGRDQPATASKSQENALKNRYVNIVAYDRTRVKVKPNQLNHNSDYINANWVDGYNKPNAYIAAQGPVPDSIPSFWQMVWEQAVQLIVMVANEVEGGKLKCHRYWPSSGKMIQTGDFRVQSVSETATPTYITREFKLTHMSSNNTVEVQHLQFVGWPDHGVPNTSREILSFRDEVYRLHDPRTPLLVHCSAGVGRTGTYISIDQLIKQAEDKKKGLNVFEVVHELRMARNYLVQTLVQYGFVYLALMDALDRGLGQAKQAVSLMEKHLSEVMVTELRDINAELAEMREEAHGIGAASVEAELEALQTTTQSHKTRVTVNERMNAFMSAVEDDQRGESSLAVASDWAGVSDRVESYRQQVDAAEFDKQYAGAESDWRADGGYDLGITLTPLESRKAAFAQQQEAYKMRGSVYREQIDAFQKAQVADVSKRIEALNQSISEAEKSVETNHAKEARRSIGNVSLEARIRSVESSETAGTQFGRVVPSKAEIEAKAKEERDREEALKAAIKHASRAQENEPEPAATGVIYDSLFDNVWQNTADSVPQVDPDFQEQHFCKLRKTPKKAAPIHPMVASMAGSKHHPMSK